MKLAIGNDHVAVEMKQEIKAYLEEKGIQVVDVGTNSPERFNYPVDPYTAKLSKQHNNTNIIAFGARVIGIETAKMIVDEWLGAEFEGGRHQTRIDMIREIEETQHLAAAE